MRLATNYLKMKAFWKVLKRFAAPYKKYLAGSVVLNLFSAVFNIFSFALLIPILNILFKMDSNVYEFIPWDGMPSKEQLMNNFYWYVSELIDKWGGSATLLILGVVFGLMTILKTGCYFASSAVMIPLRTGIVRDIRVMVYNKLLSLPMGFFSKQKKGDIIARMSGDVTEIAHTGKEVAEQVGTDNRFARHDAIIAGNSFSLNIGSCCCQHIHLIF